MMTDLKTAQRCIDNIQELREEYKHVTKSLDVVSHKMKECDDYLQLFAMRRECEALQNDLDAVSRQFAIQTDLLFGMEGIEIVVRECTGKT